MPTPEQEALFDAWIRTYEEEVGALDDASARAGFMGALVSMEALHSPAMPNIAALAACPFCGGADIFIEPDERGSGGQHVPPYHVGCKACKAEQVAETEAEAIAAWNRRAVPPKAPSMPQYWSVTVTVDGEDILSIGHDWLSGNRCIEGRDEQTIIGAAQHLLSFAGYGLPPCSFDPDAEEAPSPSPVPEPEIQSHAEPDGCPTEKAVLQRFWREHQAQAVADCGDTMDCATCLRYLLDVLEKDDPQGSSLSYAMGEAYRTLKARGLIE